MAKPNDPANAPRIDQPTAPEIFADDAAGALWHNGNLRITLESLRANHAVQPAALSRLMVGTLVMPIGAAESMARLILVAIENAKASSGNTPQTTPTLQ
jgi:hypothetical protein